MTDQEVNQVAQHVPLVTAVLVGIAAAVGVIVKAIRGIDSTIQREVDDRTDVIARELQHHTKEESIWQTAIVERLDRLDASLERIESRLDRLTQPLALKALLRERGLEGDDFPEG